jgi:hypothetical protein
MTYEVLTAVLMKIQVFMYTNSVNLQIFTNILEELAASKIRAHVVV